MNRALQIPKKKLSFTKILYRLSEIWNQPIYLLDTLF